MKRQSLFLICFLLLSHSVIFSQMRSTFRQRNPNKQGQKKQETPKISIAKMAQLSFFDAAEVIRSLKINEAAKRLAIITEIDNYNNKLIEIKAFNKDVLSTAQSFLKSKKSEFEYIEDPVIMSVASVKLKKILAPVTDKIRAEKLLLNQSFKRKFSPKEYEKWLKYQKRKTNSKRKLSQNNRLKSKGLRKGKGRQNF